MSRIKKFLKQQQLETYLLIGFPIIWILVSGILERPLFSAALNTPKNSVALYFLFGGYFLAIGFVLIYIYACLKILLWAGDTAAAKIFKEEKKIAFRAKPFLWSIAYLFFAIGVGNFASDLLTGQISQSASTARIIAASQGLNALDHRIFGFDPVLWIHQFSANPIADFLFLQSYRQLTTFFCIAFLGLLLFKKELFRKFLIAFFLAPMLALPFWYAIPAVTPNEMYRENIFALPANQGTPQLQYAQADVSQNLSDYLTTVNAAIESPQREHPLVTTDPSMHVGWGFIITYFAILLWWPLAFLFVPWLAFNILGTLYTFQHYAVDLPTGIVVAIAAIIATHYIFALEKKYYTGNYRLLHFIDEVQADVQKILGHADTYLAKVTATIWQ